MNRTSCAGPSPWIGIVALAVLVNGPAHGQTQSPGESKLIDATAVIQSFTTTDEAAIPADLLRRAYGIAVIPSLVRGGFILGGRRGKGVLVVRSENGEWSNPSFITLTGGSIGWQIGAESADMVLVFANDRSVHNIGRGKFTLGGDASAVAGPVGRHATMAVTFKAEVYGYLRSRGLFAGASFEGTRLDIDQQANWWFYSADNTARPLGDQTESTPATARRFLLTLEQAALAREPTVSDTRPVVEEAVIYPLQ